MDILGDIADTVTGWIDDIGQIVYDFFWSIFYYIAYGICKLVGIFGDMADIFAGLSKVNYDGEEDYLLNIFFTHNSVSNVYWAIALIGMIFCIAFAIVAVIRKTFDIGDKVKQSLGQILMSTVKGILMISLTTAAMLGTFSICGTVMEQIDYLFTNAEVLDLPETITFNEEQYAKMAKILNTIGNYSLNPSYNSRYNINTCFNAIRKDMEDLQNENVFRVYYETKDPDGRVVETWQSALQRIANAISLNKDIKIDQYNEELSSAMIEVMELLRNDASFKPIDSYKRPYRQGGEKISVDKLVFLMGTMSAAKNPVYNTQPGLTDPLRGPYYAGAKNIYNLEQVKQDFDIGMSMNYLIIFIAGVKLMLDLATIVFNCIASIFNVLILYLISPMVFATVPLDDGAKVKQWSVAYIVQSLGIFANIFAMRLMLILIPIIMGNDLVLVKDNVILNLVAKIVLLIGLFATTKKTTGMITGILTDQAGFQSVQAGDMSDLARGVRSGAWTAAKAGGSLGWSTIKGAGSLGVGAVKGIANKFSSNKGNEGSEASSQGGSYSSSSGDSSDSGDSSSSSKERGASSETAASSGSEGGNSSPSKEGGASSETAASSGSEGGNSSPSKEGEDSSNLSKEGGIPQSEFSSAQQSGNSGSDSAKQSSAGNVSKGTINQEQPLGLLARIAKALGFNVVSSTQPKNYKQSGSTEIEMEDFSAKKEVPSSSISGDGETDVNANAQEAPVKQPPPGLGK